VKRTQVAQREVLVGDERLLEIGTLKTTLLMGRIIAEVRSLIEWGFGVLRIDSWILYLS
jgi:hypothetical protein